MPFDHGPVGHAWPLRVRDGVIIWLHRATNCAIQTRMDKRSDISAVEAAQPDLRQLVAEAVNRGEPVDIGGGALEASFLRDIINGRERDCTPTPFGVRLRNGTLIGRLDLEGANIAFPVALQRITMETGGQQGSIIARDARIRRLSISECTFAGGIIADRSRFEGGIIVAGGRLGGPLTIRGAVVAGAVSIEGSHIGDNTYAILGAGAQITGPLVLRRCRAHGEVRLQRANLKSGLRADQLRIDGNNAGLYADSVQIGGDVQLADAAIAGPVRFENARISGGISAPALSIQAAAEGFVGAGLEVAQSVEITSAKLLGPLNLEGAAIGKRFLSEHIEIDGGETAIKADILRVGGNWLIAGARLVGGLRCPGARSGGQLRATGIKIFGSDNAIRADGAHIEGGVFLSRGVIVGAVRFHAAVIGNQFRLSGATIKVDQGAALMAPGATLRRDSELNAGFQTIGGVVLDQAHIHGTLDLTASHIRSGAVVQAGSHPGGMTAYKRRSGAPAGSRPDPNDLALSCVDATIDRVEMPARADERPRGIVDLSRAKVGAYVDWAATWPPVAATRSAEAAPEHIVLDGFTYEHMENPAGVALAAGDRQRVRAGQNRLTWLLGQSTDDTGLRLRPQAWVYLSQQLARQGLDRDARTITVARRRRERASRWSTVSGRWESRFLDWFALYGFNPWRTVAWMIATVLLFAGVWAWAAADCRARGCFDEGVFVVAKRDSYSAVDFEARYPAFHPLAYSFDVFVPFVDFGYEDHWRPNMSHAPLTTVRLPHLPAFVGGETAKDRIYADVTFTVGGVLYILGLVEKLLGLILTSLMVTAFTGLLRRHE